MTSDKYHESFPQPANLDTPVWRYIDLQKLIALLDRRELYLPRADLLGDPFEGTITRKTLEAIERVAAEVGHSRLVPTVAQARHSFRRITYVSCWCLGEHESEAMWRLYCGASGGVAIRLSYRALRDSLPGDFYVGQVNYIDFSRDAIPGGNLMSPLMHKRVACRHECEVRVVRSDLSILMRDDGTMTFDEDVVANTPTHVTLRWDAEAMVDALHVNPYADEWYRDIVVSVLRKYAPELVDRARWSTIRDDPVR